ncbi:MAG: hypothetical protein AB7O67_04815 [Vicinamibacterales bacterium]
MSAVAEAEACTEVVAPTTPVPGGSESIVEMVRGEFLEMPGLSLTLSQAARLFDIGMCQSKQVLKTLLDEGFLVCSARGAFRRRDPSVHEGRRSSTRTTAVDEEVRDDAVGLHASAANPAPRADLLDALGVELPYPGLEESYFVSLRSIRLSQLMMDAGCDVRHFADCPPAAVGYLIDPGVLRGFEQAVERIEQAAEGAGGRLVGPR